MKKSFMILPLVLMLCFSNSCQDKGLIPSGNIMTVNGPIDAKEMGITLTHEHIISNFIGAERVSEIQYDQDEIFNIVLPFLEQAKKAGCKTFVNCTPRYMLRDPDLLKRLSAATGLHILVSTGYFGAWKNRFLPSYVSSESVDQLAERMVAEWEDGIDDTGIKPGFIKIGFDLGTLPELHQKIVRAAARAHLKTGLTIASHTIGAICAFEQIEILKNEGVDPSAFIWVHTQFEEDIKTHIKAAEMGTWVSFDTLITGKIEDYVEFISNMKSANLLNRVLVSHDSFYRIDNPENGKYLGYMRLFEELIPALKESDFSEEEIEQLIIFNPQDAFAYRVRKLKD
jgi:phosphotriesterase-related protein